MIFRPARLVDAPVPPSILEDVHFPVLRQNLASEDPATLLCSIEEIQRALAFMLYENGEVWPWASRVTTHAQNVWRWAEEGDLIVMNGGRQVLQARDFGRWFGLRDLNVDRYQLSQGSGHVLTDEDVSSPRPHDLILDGVDEFHSGALGGYEDGEPHQINNVAWLIRNR
jgi:hypothetical protein